MLMQVLRVMSVYPVNCEFNAFEIDLMTGKFCNRSIAFEFQLKLRDKSLINFRLVW